MKRKKGTEGVEMLIKTLHHWDVDIQQARRIQEELGRKVSTDGQLQALRLVAGCDVAYGKERGNIVGCVVLWDVRQAKAVEVRFSYGRASFPYIPGYLSFRECFILLEALSQIQQQADVVLVDGHGIAHPRGLGLASHLGLHLNVPTVGCAKSPLLGQWKEPGPREGDLEWVYLGVKRVGAVLRTKGGVKPVFVSPGHSITLEESVRIVRECTQGYRIPEPLRQAHLLAEREKKKMTQESHKPSSLKHVIGLLAMLAGLSLAAGCAQWLALSDEAREAAFECSRDPSAPGCVPAGWGYKPGMGM